MRRWLVEHISPIVHVVIGVLAVALLTALAWSIGRSNLIVAMFSGGGLAVVIVMGGSMLTIPDNLQSRATDRMLRMASATLMHMRDGLTPEGCQAVCLLLLPETQAAAIAMTDDEATLAYAGEPVSLLRAGAPNNAPVQEVLESQHVQTFSATGYGDLGEPGAPATLRDEIDVESGRYQNTVAVIVPLMVSERAVGTIKLYYRSGRDVDRTQMTIARGLADLLSSQLTVSELDRQSQLTAQAEVKALQAQINPHFLFNTLNTMASLTRTDPVRARELLREFSTFYRRTLENSQQLIPLADELEQTRRYLHIEKARFGEDRIVETEQVDAGCEKVMVPGFIVQPIVENAVRHAMSDEGPLHIDVDAFVDGYDLILVVADDGLGMDAETAARLLEGSSQESSSASKGTGIALRNVRERIKLFYGAGSDVTVASTPGEGTSVTLRLAGAAPELDDDDGDDLYDDELDAGYLVDAAGGPGPGVAVNRGRAELAGLLDAAAGAAGEAAGGAAAGDGAAAGGPAGELATALELAPVGEAAADGVPVAASAGGPAPASASAPSVELSEWAADDEWADDGDWPDTWADDGDWDEEDDWAPGADGADAAVAGEAYVVVGSVAVPLAEAAAAPASAEAYGDGVPHGGGRGESGPSSPQEGAEREAAPYEEAPLDLAVGAEEYVR